MDSVCRFCLEPKTDDKNPLIAPCKWKGSVRYVHIECIKLWRRTTDVPEFILKCQMCLTNYKMPTKHPLENIPNIHYDTAWFFLSRPYTIVFMEHYLIAILMLQIFGQKIIDEPNSYIMPYVSIYNVMNGSFMAMSTLMFATYVAFYLPHIKQIKNKNLYTKFLTRFRLGAVFPAPYLAAVILSYMLITVSICPFGTVFGLLLPQFMDVHLEILKQINNDAEM